MKKNKLNSFLDFMLFFLLGIYLIVIFILRRWISKTFDFVYIKYNFNIVLFIISIFLLVIDLCVLLNKRKNIDKNTNKKKTKNNKWGKDFIILFRSYFCISFIIILLSISNIVFSRYELDANYVRKYNLFNKIVEEERLDSFSSISVVPSYYTGKQGNSFRILIKLQGKDNFTFMHFQNRKKMLNFLQSLKKNNNVYVDRTRLQLYYSKNVIYWNNEEQKLFEDFFFNE